MKREKVCGIYRIENLVNHKSYVGQSIDIYERWSEHRWALDNERHDNKHLMRAWHKYKEFNFEFTILEQCEMDDLNDREIYWIAHYDAYYNGYNQTKGGNGCFGKVWTIQERERVSRAILQLSTDGVVVGRFININDAEEQTGISRRQIWNCANKLERQYISNGRILIHKDKTAGGYIWVYEDELDTFKLSQYQSNIPHYKVYQYDMNWNLIKEWPSAESVKSSGYEPTTIRSVCQGNFMTAYGYLWTYEVSDIDEYAIWFRDKFDVKYIGQYSLSGELIKIWNTPRETEQDGFRAASVRQVLNGDQNKHKGYTFKYIPWRKLQDINWKGQLNYGKLQ